MDRPIDHEVLVKREGAPADVGASGLDVARPFPDLKPAGLNRQLAGERLDVRDLAGLRPGSDDRFLFQDTSFPWRITGEVWTAGGWVPSGAHPAFRAVPATRASRIQLE
jgi:hypothetical protein